MFAPTMFQVNGHHEYFLVGPQFQNTVMSEYKTHNV